jgi:hypothetical protein
MSLWGSAVAASDESLLPEDLQIHGFLSQGYVKTSVNNFYGNSEDGSWDFREIGLNASYQLRPNLLFAGQLLSRTAGEMDDGGVRVDYALLDYAPIMDARSRLAFRLGRLKNPLGFYNDTRDVPFTRSSIFLPQSIYFDRVRNLELSADGVGINGDLSTDWGEFNLQLNYGKLVVDENVERAYIFTDWPGEMKTDRPWLTGRILHSLDGGRVRLAASVATGEINYHPGAYDPLADGAIDILFWVLSFQYNEELWSLTAEYMNEPVEWKDFGPLSPFRDGATAEGWYAQLALRPWPDWEFLLRYDVSYLNKDDRLGEKTSAALGVRAYATYSKDLTLGVRWDLTEQFMLRAEYHIVEGGSWLSSRENDLATIDKYWEMFALSASYRF